MGMGNNFNLWPPREEYREYSRMERYQMETFRELQKRVSPHAAERAEQDALIENLLSENYS